MRIIFEPLGMAHQSAVMEIFNYYVERTTAAFPSRTLPEEFFAIFLKKAEGGYPSYAVKHWGKVIGFCQLSPYNPMLTFAKTAECTIFIEPAYTQQGIGRVCLEQLTEMGRKMGIQHLLSEVSSENDDSLRFHERNGFTCVGELPNIGEKLGRSFSVMLYHKDI